MGPQAIDDLSAGVVYWQAHDFRGWGMVLQLTKPSGSIQLLHWNKELPTASAADPLGLNLRVAFRLANELLYCITSITPRARYYSFFPWAFDDYNEHEYGTTGDRGRVSGILSRERAMVLGAVVHHEGAPCEGGSLGGSEGAEKIAEKNRASCDLSRWKHLRAAEGQFGAAYKGSLINLGVFKTDKSSVKDEADVDTEELDEETQAIELRELSNLGKRLAGAFGKSVRSTRYLKEGWSLKNVVDTKILKEFGARAGLCEIAGKHSDDRAVLREVLFANCDDMINKDAQRRRRMSLLLILDCVGKARAAGVSFGNHVFGEICYFKAIAVKGDGKVATKPISLLPCLTDIAHRWRVYYSNAYLGVALQSLLVCCVAVLRDRPGGIPFDNFLQEINADAIGVRFREIFGRDLPKGFFTLTPRATLELFGAKFSTSHNSNGVGLDAISVGAACSEQELEDSLNTGEASDVAGVALAALLFYLVVLRYPQVVGPEFQNWYHQQVNDPYSDVSVPGVVALLEGEFGSRWFERSNGEIISRVVWRFVIRQHQAMSYARGFGGSAPLFHVDGNTVIGTNEGFTDPRMPNSRLGSALQILDDLGLITFDEEDGYSRTREGDAWFKQEIEREAKS